MKYPGRIELELTLRCNLACPTCNRHCNVYDRMEDSDMTDEQIERFVSQVETKGKKWTIIAVMGGEPTIHPRFSEVMRLLWDRLIVGGHVEQLQIWTNGTNMIDIDNLPVRYLHPCERSIPDGRVHVIAADHTIKTHYQAFLSPKDTGQLRHDCTFIAICGFSLSTYGYTPCGPAGAIARLYGEASIIKTELPDSAGDWGDDVLPFCERCQLSALTKIPMIDIDKWEEKARREISPDYQAAFDTYQDRPAFPKW